MVQCRWPASTSVYLRPLLWGTQPSGLSGLRSVAEPMSGQMLQVLKLPTLLEGEALAVWMELSEEEQENYQRVKAQMITRMAPARFVSLEDFQGRRLHPGESLSVFLHVLKRLLDQVMPEADAATRKQLLLHQFLNGLPNYVSRQLRAAGEISDLDKPLEQAKLLLTIEEQEKTAAIQATVPAEVRGIEGANISPHGKCKLSGGELSTIV